MISFDFRALGRAFGCGASLRFWRQSPQPIDPRFLLRGIVTGTASAFLLMYVGVALMRVWWPIPLDDLELAVITHVRRIVAGRTLYVAPGLDFVPLVYPPLFYHVAAWLWTPFGGGFVPVRLVSMAASLASIVLVALIVRYETGSWRAGLLAAGLRAAVGGEIGWISLARVDSLMLFLTLAGACTLRVTRSTTGVVAAGVLFGLATLTKQPAVFVFAALTIWQLTVDWRRAVALAAGFLAAVAVIGGAWQWESRGWFAYYVLLVGANQRVGELSGTLIGIQMLLEMLPFAVVAACLLPLRVVRESVSIEEDTVRFWLCATIGAGIAGFGSKLVHGTDMNALLPVCSFLVIQLAMYVNGLVALTRRRGMPAVELLATAAVLAQFGAVAYIPALRLPESLDQGAKWVVRVSAGEDGTSMRRWLYRSPQDRSRHADSQAVEDLLSGGTPSVTAPFMLQVRQAYCQSRAAHPVDIEEALLLPGSGILSTLAAACATGNNP
jgi:4-amino-4-deoxy-L-arabinose transferase-like glycosyltransferase